jgi:hypothetical protein
VPSCESTIDSAFSSNALAHFPIEILAGSKTTEQSPCGHRTCEFSPRHLTDLGDVLDGLFRSKRGRRFRVFRRQLFQAEAKLRTSVHLQNRLFRSIAFVRNQQGDGLIELGIIPPTPLRERLEARDRQYPCRDLRTAFEFAGLAPDVGENLADDVFRRTSTADQTDEQDNADIVPLDASASPSATAVIKASSDRPPLDPILLADGCANVLAFAWPRASISCSGPMFWNIHRSITWRSFIDLQAGRVLD